MVCNLFNGEIDYINLCDLYNYNRCFGNDKIDYCCEKIINNVDEFIAEADNILHITIKLKDNDLVNKYYNKINKYNLETIIMQDSFTDRRWLEIFNKGVSKYDAINVIASIEKIENNNIISFGDGLNDLDMLEKSGIGVAMGNALGLVKEVSDYVTLSHNDDGVIYFLKEYLSISNYVD